MSVNQADIAVRIAGDLRDINKALQDLRRRTQEAGQEGRRSKRDWDQLGRALESVRSRVVGIVAAYLSFRSVLSVFGAVVRNTREQEDALAQLEARLRSTENVLGLTSEQLQAMAQGYQDVTTHSRAAVMEAQSVLITYTQIGQETFPRALEAALDFATAMRVDVARAAETVGRALGEPSRAAIQLREQGFTFSGAQLALIRSLEQTGRLAEAQAIVLDELELAYGGAARAARQTFGGALDALKNSLADLLTGSGGNLADATAELERLNEVLQDPNTRAALQMLVEAVLVLARGGVEFLTEFATLGRMIGETAAQIAGTVSEVDRLEAEIRDVDRAINNSFFGRPIKFFGQSREELVALRAELERALEAARIAESGGALPAPPSSFEPPTVTQAPRVDPRPALRAIAAQFAAARILLDDELKRLRDQLDRDLADNLVAFSDYYRRRAQLETRAIDQQIEQQRNALALVEAEIELRRELDDDIQKQEAERVKLVAQITALERQRGDVAVRAARDQAEAERKLTEQLDAVRIRLQQLQGDTVGARTAELEREFRDLLERLAVEGDREGEALIRRLIDIETARTQLGELEADYGRSLQRLARAQRSIELQVETGIISEAEGRRRLVDLHRETAQEIEELIPLMRELAEATGDPAAIERLEDLQLEVEELRNTVKTAAQEMAENLRDSGADAFSSWLDGTAKARNAWESFVQSIRSRIADLVADQAINRLIQMLGSIGGGGGGFFAQLFHSGGIVGAGGGPLRPIPRLAIAGAPRMHNGGFPGLASDEQLIIAQRGEEVLSRRDPRNRLNGGVERIDVTIQTQDAESFRRASPTQIGADLAASMQRAFNRNR